MREAGDIKSFPADASTLLGFGLIRPGLIQLGPGQPLWLPCANGHGPRLLISMACKLQAKTKSSPNQPAITCCVRRSLAVFLVFPLLVHQPSTVSRCGQIMLNLLKSYLACTVSSNTCNTSLSPFSLFLFPTSHFSLRCVYCSFTMALYLCNCCSRWSAGRKLCLRLRWVRSWL